MLDLCEKMGKKVGRNDHQTTRVKNRLDQHQGCWTLLHNQTPNESNRTTLGRTRNTFVSMLVRLSFRRCIMIQIKTMRRFFFNENFSWPVATLREWKIATDADNISSWQTVCDDFTFSLIKYLYKKWNTYCFEFIAS